MKKALTLLLLCGIANAQQIGISRSAEPVIQAFPEHPQHARVVALASDGDIASASGGSNDNIPTPADEPSLGSRARELKAQKSEQPKAKVTYIN
jgi:hypothetical protein